MSDKPLVYISGPMTGKPEFNYPAFCRAAERLRELGYEVINPAETAGGTIHLPRSTFLRIDIGYVMAAEAVALLEGWSDSKGSKLEVMVAEAMDLPIYFYNEREGLGARFHVENVQVRGHIKGGRVRSDVRAFLDHVIPPEQAQCSKCAYPEPHTHTPGGCGA